MSSSSAATETKSLVPAFDIDFGKAASALEKNDSLSVTEVLAQLVTIPVTPPPAAKKKVSKETVARQHEADREAIAALPKVFGTVKEPVSRRMFTTAELEQVSREKESLAETKKAVTKRENELNEWLSTHFDVRAEKLKLVDPEKTAKDDKGHYLIGSPGNRMEQAVEGWDKIFTREKAADKAPMSHELLLAAYEAKQITRAEYLAFTATVRVLDEKKIRTMLLSKAKRERAQEIIKMITQPVPGKLSIYMRPAK